MKPFRLSRRACLRGLGASLALPWLEIMETPVAKAQNLSPQRFLCVYSPNGFIMRESGDGFGGGTGSAPAWWSPPAIPHGTTTTDWETPPLLSALEDLRGDFSMISGLGNYPASIAQRFGGSHTRGCAALLTSSPIPDSGQDIQNGISLDQMIAAEIGQGTLFPSLEVGTVASRNGGNCEDQYSCAFNNNISWSGPTTPKLKQTNPRDIFDRLFADGVPTPMPMPVDNRYIYQKSILDAVATRTQTLKMRLGNKDNLKLDEYLNGVREVEQRINRLIDNPTPIGQCTVPDAPADTQDGNIPFPEHIDMISDLIAIAFQCDLTRVATFMFEHSFSDDRNFSFLGVNARHHQVSHDQNLIEQEVIIDRFYIDRFGYLARKMKSMTEGNSNVLDNSITYLTSEFGNGWAHDFRDAAMLIAGSGGGKLKKGLHLHYDLAPGEGTGADGRGTPDDVQLAELHLTTLQAFGSAATSFGRDGDGNPLSTTTLSPLVV